MTIRIETCSRARGEEKSRKVTDGTFTFVAIDENGKERAIPAG